MNRSALLCIFGLLFALPASSQSEILRYKSEAEQIEAKEKRERDLIEHVAYAAFLIELCADDFDFSQKGRFIVENEVSRSKWINRYIELDSQPNKPNKPRACYELLTKYGPEGSVARGWVEKKGAP